MHNKFHAQRRCRCVLNNQCTDSCTINFTPHLAADIVREELDRFMKADNASSPFAEPDSLSHAEFVEMQQVVMGGHVVIL